MESKAKTDILAKSKEAYKRGSLTTVDESGHRLWVYAKKVKGYWMNRRNIVGYFLLAFLFSAPFIKMHGHQMLLFDVVNRKFIFFGGVFWPHDFYLVVIGMLSFAVFIFLFTAIFGRLWCGWACPQTIFMEMIFRKVEYLIEGDAMAQKRLKAMEWTNEKILKKGSKWLIFFIMSFIISNVFLAYLMGSDELIAIVKEPPSKHVGGLLAISIFSLIFYFVYTYMREQVCTIICPYGRWQSVMLDDKSLIVAYDYKRGEQREKWGRKRASEAGDCIDCKQCVDVCPTGIDIRNGTQLECINCTSCIDACDAVMLKIGKDPGLVKYASRDGIEKGEHFRMTSRRIIYSVILVLLLSVFAILLAVRSDIQANILRTPGTEFVDRGDGKIQNVYNFKILNKTFKDEPVELRLESVPGIINTIGNGIVAPGDGYYEGIISIEIEKKYIIKNNLPIKIGVYVRGDKMQSVRVNFMGPIK